MSQDELSGPDINGVVADANAVGLKYVVIGGFSVIANGYLRATKDSDLLVPDGPETDHLRVNSRHGIVDILRGGLAPLDYDTVANEAVAVDIGGQLAPVASLRSIVGFKRLADRPRDRNDLEELEAFHGELPIDPIPGLDS